MKVLHPKIKPFAVHSDSYVDEFYAQLRKCVRVNIFTGYISKEAIFNIAENLDAFPPFNLLVGMPAIEGFNEEQYLALRSLNSKMAADSKGVVYVSPTIKYHGKCSIFFNESVQDSVAILGSTNLSIIGDTEKRQFEVDILITDPGEVRKLISIHEDFLQRCVDIEDFTPDSFVSTVADVDLMNEYMRDDDHLNIEKVDAGFLSNLQNIKAKCKSFELELKPEAKSNLNVAFGRGRGGGCSGRGVIIPRSWLEFEIIVSKKIYFLPDYPAGIEFCVVTNDGYKFKCSTQGGNKGDLRQGKNFRSIGDLQILGAWVKGKLVRSGVVNYGDFITKEHLDSYGSHSVTLYNTNLTCDGLPLYFMEY